MKASRSPFASDKRKPRKPYTYSYSEAFTDVALIGVGTFVLAWLNLPTYAGWIIVAAICLVFIVVAWFFRVRASNRPTS
jgi:high-affinity Fe2+/Pb2+ permease